MSASAKTKNIPEKTIAEFAKKTRELGISIDLKNLDERINKNTDHMSAFPEILEFNYKSKKDLNDIMTILIKLWNSYPRDEFNGKSPDEVFSETGKEAAIKQLLSSELMSSINPSDFSSEKEFRKAGDDFQKKWLDKPRKDLGGKTPMEVVLEERQKTGNPSKDLHLSFAREKVKINDKSIDDFFEDIPEKAKLKNILKKEQEYVYVLGAIDYSIARYYLTNPETTDKDVTRALKNFRKDYDKEFDEDSIEWAIKHAALDGLEKHTENHKISKHEFFLVIDYILQAISNRDWTGDKQVYVKWVCNFFGLLKGKEKKEYEDSYKEIGIKFGLSKREISLIKDPPSELSCDATELTNKIGRNDPCPCGSGKKYKKCCFLKEMEEPKDDSFREKVRFADTVVGKTADKIMKTLNKGHDEDMNFECNRCNKKISAHNNDWHGGMCDDCFNKHISEIEDE